eukprot:11358526-Alexandrium_andersonii.AAC.2
MPPRSSLASCAQPTRRATARKWRDYNFAAEGGGGGSSRSTSGNRRKGRKGRKKGKSRSQTPDKKNGKANVVMDQITAEGGELGVQAEIDGAPRFEDSVWRAVEYEPS